MTEFEKSYNRLFLLRGADTKHMHDCELVWVAAIVTAVAAERERCAKICEFSDGHAAQREHGTKLAALIRGA